jgi:cytochrome c peroxidase
MAHVDHQVPGDDINPRLLRRFKPIRAEFTDGTPSSVAQVELGRQLFFDTRLSRSRDLSCNSCHHLDKYGVDNQPTSTGMSGQHGHRNSPSVYHAAGAFTSFWDGRAANVEEQAKGPILNPVEMGMASPEAVVAVLAATPGYVSAFHAAFPGDANSVTYDNLGKAIGAFERRLVTPARWDKYLLGDHAALSRDEVAGFRVFTDIGCVTCHTGELIGGSMFQKVGVAKAWPNQTDRGRFEITKLPSDSMVFKVPSLRNVVKTGPYFHDGSVASLSEAVRLMGRHQIGEELTDEDVRVIVAWLGSLTGEIPADYIKVPTLPPDAVASRP